MIGLGSWLTERRRKHILENAFPEAWQPWLERNVGHWALLEPAEREHLRTLAQVFIAEKHWEGCGGLVLDDEMRVTIAAEACLLLLARDHSLYDDVDSILVYPTTVVRPQRAPQFFARNAVEPVGDAGPALLGEAHGHGPVILVWDAVKRGARDPRDGRNVVIHEFAHKIDMLDGGADGTPPLPSAAARRRWAEVCSEAFLALRAHVDRGEKAPIDPYGATNEAEFFAVATEAFFERPESLARELPALYELLRDFYGQDPGERVKRARAHATPPTDAA